LGFRSTDVVSRVHVDLACNGPLDAVLMVSIYSTVQNVDYGHLESLNLSRESTTF